MAETAAEHPQVARSRSAVIAAVADLIQTEGAASVTHQRVAERAGVGRATVYRHWPERLDLLTEALTATPLPFLEPEPGPLVERLQGALWHISEQLNAPGITAMAATLVERAQWDDGTRVLRDRLVAQARANLAAALDEAEQTGELRGRPDEDDLFAQLIGPLWVCRTLQARPITEGMVRRVMFDALAPWLADSADVAPAR